MKVIPAHKIVLAIGIPVFFVMFYGQLVEATDTIELPDCDFESLLELFRSLYSDNVNLTGNNVMQVLYLAKKYVVPSLAEKCTEYLRDALDGSNVFCILPYMYANKFEDTGLEDRCWKVIETETEEAVTSDDFVTVDRSILESLVTKKVLTVKEVELFKAVDRWARKECKRQGIIPDGDAKRRMLGEEILRSIRFPLMTQREFCSVVPGCNILTMKEIVDMMKYYSQVVSSPLQFLKIPRIHCFHWCFRFGKFTSSAIAPNLSPTLSDYGGVRSSICVTTNKDVDLLGVQHFGCEDGVYKVSTEIKDTTNGSSLVRESGWYLSGKDKICDYYFFDVLLPYPVFFKKW